MSECYALHNNFTDESTYTLKRKVADFHYDIFDKNIEHSELLKDGTIRYIPVVKVKKNTRRIRRRI